MKTLFGLGTTLLWNHLNKDRFQAEAAAIAAEKERALQEWKVNYSLTCRRCKGLAAPILGTHNRYECKCGSKFAGAKHSGNNGHY